MKLKMGLMIVVRQIANQLRFTRSRDILDETIDSNTVIKETQY